MKQLDGKNVTLRDHELLRREWDNRAYMLRLPREKLVRNFMLEAGLWTDSSEDPDIFTGWESPTCQLRGHFLGHWLSAAAMRYAATGDPEIKGRADAIIHDLKRCQDASGNGWVGSIPEKYLDWIARGRPVWAPHYTLHKTWMGLVDMAKLAGSAEALEVADRWGEWFEQWACQFDRARMDSILDFETGGMLEIWAEMLELTGKERYRRLLKQYDRPRLFEELLKGKDPLTNMHANTTIPEILGCVRAYEVTGEKRYRDIVEAYWKCAVTDRGSFATGGQTSGEIWSPKGDQSRRLGRKDQEHCVVYNMMRLADALFRWTGDARYADYIERNLYNGVMAQGYYRWRGTNGYHLNHPETGLIAYFLPLKGGDHKGWGTETSNFYCCHGTLVQANAALNRYFYYQQDREIWVCQFFDSDASFELDGQTVTLSQRIDPQNGSFQTGSNNDALQAIGEVTSRVIHNPDVLRVVLTVQAEKPVHMKLHIRVPFWADECQEGFRTPDKEVWQPGESLVVEYPRTLWSEPLGGDPDRVAFLYGPVLLAGLTDCELTLHTDPEKPEKCLTRCNEREWGSWTTEFITTTEERAVEFVPLYEIGYENYAVYFRIAKS